MKRTGQSVIRLLCHIALGVALGALVIFVSMCLDHLNVLHVGAAHNLRSGAYSLLSDPTARSGVEDGSGLRFMEMSEYASIREEIDAADAEVSWREEDAARHAATVERNRREIEAIRDEHARLAGHPLVRVDAFCWECPWYNGIDCRERVRYGMETWGVGRNRAMIMAMESSPTCRRKGD